MNDVEDLARFTCYSKAVDFLEIRFEKTMFSNLDSVHIDT